MKGWKATVWIDAEDSKIRSDIEDAIECGLAVYGLYNVQYSVEEVQG